MNLLSKKVMPMPMLKLRCTKCTKKSGIVMKSNLESEEEVLPARRMTRGDHQVHFPPEASLLAQLRGTQSSSARLLKENKRKQVCMLSYTIKLPFNNYIIDKHNDTTVADADIVTDANIVADVDAFLGLDVKTKLVDASVYRLSYITAD